MQRFLAYIGGGALAAVIGIVMLFATLDDYSPNPFQLGIAGLLVAGGLLVAQVGVVGWGVFIGHEEISERRGVAGD